jgi:hypothetical protein
MTGIRKEHVIKEDGKKGCKKRKKENDGGRGDQLFSTCLNVTNR